MMKKRLSQSLEDYLEAIYQISRQTAAAHANRIAQYLGVGKSSVSWAMNQLAEKGLIHYTPYASITLTESGLQQAKQIANRHDQIQRFLEDVLGINKEESESNACRMEHVVDRVVLDRMKQFMNYLEQNHPGAQERLNAFYKLENPKNTHSSRIDTAQMGFSEPSRSDGESKKNISADELIEKVTKDRDQSILDRLLKILHESGIQPGTNEIAVMQAFFETERHQSLAQIQQRARIQDVKVDIRTVERVMNMLCEYKIARVIRFQDQVLYEHYHPESHHDHMFCVKCGTIVEFYDPQLEILQIDNADSAEFRVLTHNLDIFGVCRDCLRRESRVRDLADCLAGEVVEIIRIVAEEAIQNRISHLGLVPGVVAEVLSDHCPGQSVMVLAGTTRLMLDGELARKIRVVPASPEAGPLWAERRERRRHRHGAEMM